MGDMSEPALCDLWEQEISIRALAREGACLTRWSNPRVTGVPSTGAMALNIRALEILAEWWASKNPDPQSVPIDPIRAQAWVIQKKLFGFIIGYYGDCHLFFLC